MRGGVVVYLVMALAVLAGCQQSGRPRTNVVVAAPPAFGQVADGSYVVAPGDTLAVVAKRTNTPIRSLIDLNGLQPPYRLRGGERLVLQPRTEYTVQSGDTVQLIALSQGVSPSALIQLNNLSAPYTLQVGQQLVLPSETDVPSAQAPAPSGAPAVASTGVLAPLPGTADSPAAKPETIGAVDKAQSEPVADPNSPTELTPTEPTLAPPTAGEPRIAPAEQIEPGIDSWSLAPLEPAEAAEPESDQANDATVLPPPPPAIIPEPSSSPSVEPAEQVEPAESAVAAGKASDFIWPVDGKIVSRFGATAEGLRNDGINIAAPEGAPVKAAADGVVAYAGNELRGFGNMILIKHADNWVTAYAHNSGLLVKKGDKVAQGQVIARVGSTGNVANPQLHFEIRNGTKAVDPLEKLGG